MKPNVHPGFHIVTKKHTYIFCTDCIRYPLVIFWGEREREVGAISLWPVRISRWLWGCCWAFKTNDQFLPILPISLQSSSGTGHNIIKRGQWEVCEFLIGTHHTNGIVHRLNGPIASDVRIHRCRPALFANRNYSYPLFHVYLSLLYVRLINPER